MEYQAQKCWRNIGEITDELLHDGTNNGFDVGEAILVIIM
jgi:hypothetical protein